MAEQTIAILDIGSSKICCFIAEVDDETNRPRVIGIGHRESRGLNLGTVVDMEETESAIRTAVDAAEKMAGGAPIENVTVNLSAGEPKSAQLAVEVDVAGHEISDADVTRVLDLGRDYLNDHERFVIHSRPTSFNIDGVSGVRDPIGMFGEKLGVEMHVTSAALSPLRNLQTCINNCHLNMAGIVFTPYASGLSTLVSDEMELGSICVDIGGGVTTIAAFKDNEFIYGDMVPFGGHHVTKDIAQGLSTPLQSAERLKTLFGNCMADMSTVRNQIDVTQIGDNGQENVTTIPRRMLTSIIEPRVEEIFEIVREKIKIAGLERTAGRRIIITGGTSQMGGIEELARKVFGCSVRVGRPLNVDGLADTTAGGGFATGAGLLLYAALRPEELHFKQEKKNGAGIVETISNWFKENF
ncbi:MAG: cell division protein FtsA [Emcibacteraceae bacterium]|nr:cell division protein FtsA [Emcibacteraceae bacterium]MDG1996876.1 cell division protein FtsA [Emcibacteraceae bacterium]